MPYKSKCKNEGIVNGSFGGFRSVNKLLMLSLFNSSLGIAIKCGTTVEKNLR